MCALRDALFNGRVRVLCNSYTEKIAGWFVSGVYLVCMEIIS